MKKLLVLLVIFAVALGVIVMTHRSSDTTMSMQHSANSTATTKPQDNPQAVATNTVKISNFNFSPATITVTKGSTVTWTNDDSVAHTVTADTSVGPQSTHLASGASYTYTFSAKGTFHYHCDIHDDMKGTVVVTD